MECTYEIWRVQNFNNSGKDNIKYNKINAISKRYFQSDNHITLESAQREADRYIKYIQNSTDRQLSVGFDQIYIIQSNTPVESAHVYQSSYYDMWSLFTLENADIPKLQSKPRPKNLFSCIFLFLECLCCCCYCCND